MMSIQKSFLQKSLKIGGLSLLLLTPSTLLAESVTADKAYEIAQKAYLYTYPMVENYRTIYQFAVNDTGAEYKGPINEVNSEARVYTPKDTTIVTPNSDTPYSYLIADLRADPLVITLPAIEKDRYYSLQMVDLYTHNAGYIGTRIDGNNGGKFLLSGPSWQGAVPEGIDRVISIPTELGMGLYRTQLLNAQDLEKVKAIQDGYTAITLSEYLGEPAKEVVEIDYPAIDIASTDENYWDYANFLLQFSPPLKDETALREQFTLIGLDGTGKWSQKELSPDIIAAMDKAQADTKATILQGMNALTTTSNLFGSPEEMQGKYFERAVGAMAGLYGNSAVEALYPAYQVDENGEVLDASQYNYTLTFPAGELPPVDAFWSLTLYDATTNLLVDNTLNRYLINSTMMDDLQKNADGSTTIYIQSEAPEAALIPNWLPALEGPIALVMRLYLPQDSVINGEWTIPSLEKVEKK